MATRKTASKTKAKNTDQIHSEVADTVIEMMKTSGSDWIKSWSVGKNNQPTSMSTGNAYQGINWLILGMAKSANDYSTGQWATYAQWFKMGGGVREGKKLITPSNYQVRKGSKSQMVILYKPMIIRDKDTGDEKSIPLMRSFNVFNADQVEGYTPEIDTELDHVNTDQIITLADTLAFEAGATVKNEDLSSAFYVPSMDYINMPKASQFKTESDYSATLLHELTHWSGHAKRCDRDLKNKFGSKDYAQEELCAELGSAMLCGSLGISAQPRDDHAKYLNNWIERLTSDPKAIFKAAAAAQKAASFILDAQLVQQNLDEQKVA